MMCGLPSTGKTTVAGYLVAATRAQLLSTDGLRRELFKQGSLQDVLGSDDPSRYDLQRIFDAQPSIPDKYQQLIWEQNGLVYEEIIRRIPQFLANGDAVLDGTFSKTKIRERAYNISRSTGHRPYLIYCVCSEDIIKQRLARRGGSEGELSDVVTIEVYYKVKERFEDPSADNATVITYDSGNGNVDIRNWQLGAPHDIAMIQEVLHSIVAERR